MNDFDAFRERAKELRCLYRVNDAMLDRTQAPGTVFLHVLSVIPEGWQWPDSTGARIEYLGRSYVGPGYTSLGQKMTAPLRLWRTEVGFVEVSSTFDDRENAVVFLPEEDQLLNAIARRLGEYLEWKHTQTHGREAAGLA